MKYLRIRDWQRYFENNRTKDFKYGMAWVPIPSKQDGEGYAQLLDHSDGAAHYGAWIAMVLIAGKSQPRGSLLRDGTHPHNAETMSRKSRIPSPVFEAVIPRLIDIGWIEEVAETQPPQSQHDALTTTPQASGQAPPGATELRDNCDLPAGAPQVARTRGTEPNYTEPNRTEPNETTGTEPEETTGKKQKSVGRILKTTAGSVGRSDPAGSTDHILAERITAALKPVNAEKLSDPSFLLKMFERVMLLEPPFLSNDEDGFLLFLAAAEHAKSKGVNKPGGNFVSTIREGDFTCITPEDRKGAQFALRKIKARSRSP